MKTFPRHFMPSRALSSFTRRRSIQRPNGEVTAVLGDGKVDGQASVAQSNPGTLILLLFLLFDGDLNLPLGEIRFV